MTQISAEDAVNQMQGVMDDVSDQLADVYQKVGRLEPRLGGDGRRCVEIMDTLIMLQQQLEAASGRSARGAP